MRSFYKFLIFYSNFYILSAAPSVFIFWLDILMSANYCWFFSAIKSKALLYFYVIFLHYNFTYSKCWSRRVSIFADFCDIYSFLFLFIVYFGLDCTWNVCKVYYCSIRVCYNCTVLFFNNIIFFMLYWKFLLFLGVLLRTLLFI